jgi:hypothetical protein
MYASTMLVALHDINSQLRTSSFIYGMATQRLVTNKRPLVTWTKSLGAVSEAPAKNSERRAFRLGARTLLCRMPNHATSTGGFVSPGSRRLVVRVRYHVQQLALRMRLNRLDDPRPQAR